MLSTSLSEEHIVYARMQGDRHTFGVLYERYVGLVYRYLYSQTRVHEIADDLTSETFTHALAAFSRFQPTKPFAPWILRIARNTLIDHGRKSMRIRDLVARLSGLDLTQSYTHTEWTENADFHDLTEGLPRLQRTALALRFLFNLEVEEVGAVIGKTPAATRMLLMRALRTLRARGKDVLVS